MPQLFPMEVALGAIVVALVLVVAWGVWTVFVKKDDEKQDD